MNNIEASAQYLARLYRPDPKYFVLTPAKIEAVLTEKQNLHKARIERAKDMYLKGYSHIDIGKELAVSPRQAAIWTRPIRDADAKAKKKAKHLKRLRVGR